MTKKEAEVLLRLETKFEDFVENYKSDSEDIKEIVKRHDMELYGEEGQNGMKTRIRSVENRVKAIFTMWGLAAAAVGTYIYERLMK